MKLGRTLEIVYTHEGHGRPSLLAATNIKLKLDYSNGCHNVILGNNGGWGDLSCRALLYPSSAEKSCPKGVGFLCNQRMAIAPTLTGFPNPKGVTFCY
jgi:hypothetical protein